MQTEQPNQPSLLWLASGLILGLVGVLFSIITPSWPLAVGADVVAIINGTPITREKYLSHLEALANDKKDAIDEKDSLYVLQRIIEEELLVQRGVEVGLLQSDKRTRAALVNGMISMTTTSAASKVPSKNELSEFYQENIGYFTPTARLRAGRLIVQGENAKQKAFLAYQRLLTGENFQQVSQQLGATVALTLPNTLLPPNKLREYLGPSATQALMTQDAGFISTPEATAEGFLILQLFEKEVEIPPHLEDIQDQVEAEYVRRAGDRALREYLDWLTERADISYPSELPR